MIVRNAFCVGFEFEAGLLFGETFPQTILFSGTSKLSGIISALFRME
jgi:hypothetical protein